MRANTGVAAPGLSDLKLAGTFSILQPNLCKIRVGRRKEASWEEGGERLLGRMEEGAPGRWGWRRELGVCERIAGVRS